MVNSFSWRVHLSYQEMNTKSSSKESKQHIMKQKYPKEFNRGQTRGKWSRSVSDSWATEGKSVPQTKAVGKQGPQNAPAKTGRGDGISVRYLYIEPRQRGRLIGRGGLQILGYEKQFDVKISVNRDPLLPVTVRGKLDNINNLYTELQKLFVFHPPGISDTCIPRQEETPASKLEPKTPELLEPKPERPTSPPCQTTPPTTTKTPASELEPKTPEL